MLRILAGWCVLYSVLFVAAAVRSDDTRQEDITIGDLATAVADQEKLCSRLDVTLVKSFFSGIDESRADANPSEASNGAQVVQVTRSTERIRCVTKNGMYRLEVDGTRRMNGADKAFNHVGAFDGDQTCTLYESGIVNIRQHRLADNYLIDPHTLMFRTVLEGLPFSVLLGGTEAIMAHDPSLVQEGQTRSVVLDGREVIDGVVCIKITMTNAFDGQLRNRWSIWIDPARGCLPLRSLNFAVPVSTEIPIAEGTMTDIREIAPGVWYPYRSKYQAYHRQSLQEGKRVPTWSEEINVENVALSSQPVAFFSEMKIPSGAYVYHIAKDGKIERSYEYGRTPSVERTSSVWWWVIATNAVLAAIVVAMIGVRYCRRRNKGGFPQVQ